MSIPVHVAAAPAAPGTAWAGLSPPGKRERLFGAAAAVFSAQGLDAPMSDVADAAGAGVASIYRCFGSKHELLAALVCWRMDQISDAASAARSRPGDRWSALTEMLSDLVAKQAAEPFVGEALAIVGDHPDVIVATGRATDALEGMLAAARTEGRLRADATSLDLRLVFAATRAATRVEPDSWPRMLQLMLDALDTRR